MSTKTVFFLHWRQTMIRTMWLLRIIKIVDIINNLILCSDLIFNVFRYTHSCFSEEKKLSTTALSKHVPAMFNEDLNSYFSRVPRYDATLVL